MAINTAVGEIERSGERVEAIAMVPSKDFVMPFEHPVGGTKKFARRVEQNTLRRGLG